MYVPEAVRRHDTTIYVGNGIDAVLKQELNINRKQDTLYTVIRKIYCDRGYKLASVECFQHQHNFDIISPLVRF